MTDKEITELYFARSENAIRETAKKYGKYCHTIADRILHSREDSEECVSDTYMRNDTAEKTHQAFGISREDHAEFRHQAI